MAYSEPYSAMYDAIRTAAAAAGGPFATSGKIDFWLDDGIDDLTPDERLIQALCRTIPRLLICETGGSYDDAVAGGGNTHEETITVTLRFACGAPGAGRDYEQPLRQDGTTYWGAWSIRKWLIDMIAVATMPGFVERISPSGWRLIRMGQAGLVGVAMTWRAKLLHVFDD